MAGQSKDCIERMRVAIEALPEPTRIIYRAHLVDGLDYRAIARDFGLRIADVEQHIALAIVLLDRALREAGDA